MDVKPFEAQLLDEWLGGSYWKIVQQPNSTHCSYIASNTSCKMTIKVKDLHTISHSSCGYCTYAVGLGLDPHEVDAEKSNPFFMLAATNKLPSSIDCFCSKKFTLRYFVLTFETTRLIELDTMTYRMQLHEAI